MKKVLLVLMLLVLAPALHAADPLAVVKDLEIVKSLLGPQAKILEARDLGASTKWLSWTPGEASRFFT